MSTPEGDTNLMTPLVYLDTQNIDCDLQGMEIPGYDMQDHLILTVTAKMYSWKWYY